VRSGFRKELTIHASRVGVCALCAGALPALVACRTTPRPIFEEVLPAIVWPPAPQPARIRYVGELRTSGDLKPVRRPLDGIGQLFLGKRAPAPLYGPRAVVCTKDGHRVWVADPGGRCMHLFNLDRRTYLRVDRVGGNPLLSPVGVCTGPPGSIYVCDSEQSAVYRLGDQNGELLDVLRIPEELQRPAAIHYDEKAEELFVVDVTAHDVKILSPAGGLLRVVGRRGGAPGEFNFPSAIAGDGEKVWIADSGNHRVQAISRSGEPLVSFGQAGDAPGDLALPKSVALDPDGHVFVVDGRFENIQIFQPDGRLLLFFGEEGTGPGQFWLPGGIFIEPTGRIWVCDLYNRRLQVFQYVRESEGAP